MLHLPYQDNVLLPQYNGHTYLAEDQVQCRQKAPNQTRKLPSQSNQDTSTEQFP